MDAMTGRALHVVATTPGKGGVADGHGSPAGDGGAGKGVR
jgi:hypothetical protein